MSYAQSFMKKLKKAFPNALIVNGGSYVSAQDIHSGELLAAFKRNVHGEFSCDKEESGAKFCLGEVGDLARGEGYKCEKPVGESVNLKPIMDKIDSMEKKLEAQDVVILEQKQKIESLKSEQVEKQQE